MFEFVSNNRQAVTVFLGLVTLGLLVGGGVAGYSADAGGDYLAKVGSVKITNRDLAMANGGQPVADAQKAQALQGAIQKQLLLNEAAKRYIQPSNEQLQAQILKIDAFKENGKFSVTKYQSLLAAQQMSIPQFEARLAEDMRLQLLAGGIANSSFGSQAVSERLVNTLAEPRDVSVLTITPDRFLPQVKVGDADIKRYYDAHQLDYRVPERVKVSYIVLSRDEMIRNAKPTAEQVQAYFDAHKAELTPEERSARHILIKVDAKASKEEKAAALKKINDLLAQATAHKDKFADLAKQYSQDEGSAPQGGDLGYFGHGMMTKAFDAAAFKLAKGEISPVVETEFGYHIILLDNIRTKTLADVKPQIEQKLGADAVQKQFPTDAEKFSDMVYQQADSLQPTATAFKLQIRESDWLTRDKSADPLLNNSKLREAIFGDDVLVKKHNSEAIEVSPGTMVVARVAAHEAAKQQPLADVSANITETLKREAAAKLAQADGKKTLASLQAGSPVAMEWPAAKAISRLQPDSLNKQAVEAVFALPAGKPIAYAGIETPNGFTLFKVSPSANKPIDDAMRKGLMGSMGQMAGQQSLGAYLAQLRKEQAVEVR